MNILLSTAGSGNANNIIRSLRESKYKDARIVGTNVNKYDLAKSLAPKNYLVPKGVNDNYIPAINHIIEREDIDLFIPNTEWEIKPIAPKINDINTKTFLPNPPTIDLCIDKLALTKELEGYGVPVAKTVELDGHSNIELVLNELQDNEDDLVWCRLKEGAGSRGAAPFKTAEQISFWLDYWREFKGCKRSDFILSEYLPGRDYHFFSLWNHGELVIGKTCERLAYTCSKYALSGTSSSPSIGQQVYNRDVINSCVKAVQSIDKEARGIFAIDLKENSKGEPCITEINIGRFPRINIFFNLTGIYNMAELYVRAAMGEEVPENVVDDLDTEKYLLRDIDNEPLIIDKKKVER